jgi:hypothetical protein
MAGCDLTQLKRHRARLHLTECHHSSSLACFFIRRSEELTETHSCCERLLLVSTHPVPCLVSPPPRMRALDLKVMYELGRHVPLVPVVTKVRMQGGEACEWRGGGRKGTSSTGLLQQQQDAEWQGSQLLVHVRMNEQRGKA